MVLIFFSDNVDKSCNLNSMLRHAIGGRSIFIKKAQSTEKTLLQVHMKWSLMQELVLAYGHCIMKGIFV